MLQESRKEPASSELACNELDRSAYQSLRIAAPFIEIPRDPLVSLRDHMSGSKSLRDAIFRMVFSFREDHGFKYQDCTVARSEAHLQQIEMWARRFHELSDAQREIIETFTCSPVEYDARVRRAGGRMRAYWSLESAALAEELREVRAAMTYRGIRFNRSISDEINGIEPRL